MLIITYTAISFILKNNMLFFVLTSYRLLIHCNWLCIVKNNTFIIGNIKLLSTTYCNKIPIRSAQSILHIPICIYIYYSIRFCLIDTRIDKNSY